MADEQDSNDDARRVRRHQAPSSRALIGGLLVAASVVGLLIAYQAATRPPTEGWVVAARAIEPGRVVTQDDLAFARGVLPDEASADLYPDWQDLVGTVARRHIDANQLFRTADIEQRNEADSAVRRVALKVDAADALGGALRPGQTVDVVAVESGEVTKSLSIAEIAPVSSALGDGTAQQFVVTLITPDAKVAAGLVAAHRADGIVILAPGKANDDGG